LNRRSRITGFGSAALLVVAGIACAVAFSGGLGQNLAFALVALGLILGTALVFYEVGLTEDKERARERRAKEEGKVRPQPHPPEPRRRDGLDRLRGRPRRLR
jgi:hypothetical protein